MDVMKLMERLKGNVLANKARVVVDDKIIIIGRLHGHEWVPTDQGIELEKKLNTSEAEASKAATKKANEATTKKGDGITAKKAAAEANKSTKAE